MERKRFKPKVDKLFFSLFIPTTVLCLAVTVIPAIFDPEMLFFGVPLTLFVEYFLISPLFGYVRLDEDRMLVKYGFFLKKEIEYKKIRSVERDRKFYSESMMALKNSLDHVNIKYNSFDVTTVSVKDNDEFIKELDERRSGVGGKAQT